MFSMHARFVDDGRRCRHCHWMERTPRGGMGCLNPKCCYGTCTEHRACSAWMRETGSDDDLSEGPLAAPPPTTPYLPAGPRPCASPARLELPVQTIRRDVRQPSAPRERVPEVVNSG
jgi:hypothetical protein